LKPKQRQNRKERASQRSIQKCLGLKLRVKSYNACKNG
jgi:hypothetical protein